VTRPGPAEIADPVIRKSVSNIAASDRKNCPSQTSGKWPSQTVTTKCTNELATSSHSPLQKHYQCAAPSTALRVATLVLAAWMLLYWQNTHKLSFESAATRIVRHFLFCHFRPEQGYEWSDKNNWHDTVSRSAVPILKSCARMHIMMITRSMPLPLTYYGQSFRRVLMSGLHSNWQLSAARLASEIPMSDWKTTVAPGSSWKLLFHQFLRGKFVLIRRKFDDRRAVCLSDWVAESRHDGRTTDVDVTQALIISHETQRDPPQRRPLQTDCPHVRAGVWSRANYWPPSVVTACTVSSWSTPRYVTVNPLSVSGNYSSHPLMHGGNISCSRQILVYVPRAFVPYSR